MSHHYQDLVVWQVSMELVSCVYETTQHFPGHELYGLTNQIRRSAVSVPSNIAEGQGRLSRKEFRQFLGQARGSLLELETQLLIAKNLGYVRETEVERMFSLSGRTSRLLHGLLRSVGRSAPETENQKPETRNEERGLPEA